MKAFQVTLGLLLLTVCSASPLEEDSSSDEHGQYKGPKGTTCPCGWTNKAAGRIVNGKEAYVNEYPWLVGLGTINSRGNVNLFCGASIISPYHVLTAAHCTVDDEASSLAVVAGEHDITKATESKFTKVYRVAKKVEHTKYNADTYEYDIALLSTVSKIDFNEAVGPACLPAKAINLKNQVVRIAGWGDLAYNGASATKLMKVKLMVSDLSACSAKFPYNPVNTKEPYQFCTYTLNKDSCQGDSGGPVFWLDPETNRYTVVGLVSFGMGCATPGYPGVNIDVFAFDDWIKKNMKALHATTQNTCTKA